MKTYILIMAIGILSMSCSKDNKQPEEGDPVTYSLNFELLKGDGSLYGDGEVEITSFPLKMENGNLEGQYEWYGMGKINTEFTNGQEKELFGGPCGGPNCIADYIAIGFASSRDGVDVNGPVPFEKDKYWLLRYANEDVDTLRIHDIQTIEPYNRTFTFFVNEQPLESTYLGYDEYAITIQK